jgi:hypothetical protein
MGARVRGIGMGMRQRFGVTAAVLLVLAVALQIVAINLATGSAEDGFVQPSYLVPTLLQTLTTFCVASAIVLVVGIVASLVVDEALVRRLEVDAAAEGEADDSGQLAAYGSDPETL